jgi:hypothetical protein
MSPRRAPRGGIANSFGNLSVLCVAAATFASGAPVRRRYRGTTMPALIFCSQLQTQHVGEIVDPIWLPAGTAPASPAQHLRPAVAQGSRQARHFHRVVVAWALPARGEQLARRSSDFSRSGLAGCPTWSVRGNALTRSPSVWHYGANAAAPQPRSSRPGTVDQPAELHLPILGLLLQIFPTSGYETIA